ncbi:hypothetical protein BTO30_15010 [Domibacillus antri]|uniref:Uncharacterized protein n=1 Tax=Domibacillus antri TaxID=1714264 RepID=A0A1Q8Q257_9BACI|nr:hypothetical protein [Domibacillus antri]OLN21424.1 hypothetical protein BTO30_15010 [Domibacillus antri]
MSEWLTTGQMIDRILEGEVARNTLGQRVKIHSSGALVWFDNDQMVDLNKRTVMERWQILPNYVSFEVAMEALKEGNDVTFHPEGQPKKKITPPQFILLRMECIEIGKYSLSNLINGKWSIVEDKLDE